MEILEACPICDCKESKLFITTKDLGYSKDQIIVIPTQTGWNPEADKTVERFRAMALQNPSILSVGGTSSSFNQGS